MERDPVKALLLKDVWEQPLKTKKPSKSFIIWSWSLILVSCCLLIASVSHAEEFNVEEYCRYKADRTVEFQQLAEDKVYNQYSVWNEYVNSYVADAEEAWLVQELRGMLRFAWFSRGNSVRDTWTTAYDVCMGD